jgi:hypothetical protein
MVGWDARGVFRMDTMRGNFGSLAESEGYDPVEEESGRDVPPASIGQDERRMQVRAYNHWASLLDDRNFPSVEDLDPENLPDFGPYSVLLDFSSGIEDPGVAFLGDELATECDVSVEELRTLADVPTRSLLSRITDHYLQIIANQAPIGSEAEFVNQRGATIAYRGILLPYSSDDDTIDFIFGVINWKELADAQASDELLLEVDQALEPRFETVPAVREEEAPLTDWADGPGATPANDLTDDRDSAEIEAAEMPALDAEDYGDDEAGSSIGGAMPRPSFGFDDDGDDETDFALADEEHGEDEDERGSPYGSLLKMPIDLSASANRHQPIDLSQAADLVHAETDDVVLPLLDPAEMGLGDWLASAREMAAAAHNSEDRTRNALYGAIGLAYDFSLAADEAPAEFGELLADAGLTMQDRAPMTPVVKLVFGADYDKTRLTEYAAALTHARRLALPRGMLGEFLSEAEGGLKGVVKAERRLRKEEAGKAVEPIDAPRQALAKKLRALPAQDFAELPAEGSEFALVMIRRTDTGEIELIGEVPDDVALIERAARRLLG